MKRLILVAFLLCLSVFAYAADGDKTKSPDKLVDVFFLNRVTLSATVERNSNVIVTDNTNTITNKREIANLYNTSVNYSISTFNLATGKELENIDKNIISDQEFSYYKLLEAVKFYVSASYGNTATETNTGTVAIETDRAKNYAMGAKFETKLVDIVNLFRK
jgi:hypothetical protein